MSRKDSTSRRKGGGDFIASHLRDIPRSGIRDFFDIVSTRKGVISLGIGEPGFRTPWHICEGAIYALERGATNYTSNLGLESLRKAIASYVRELFSVAYDPASEILVTVGVSEALDLAIRSVVEPGDEVLYHEPCYVCYSPLVTFAHGKAVAVGTSGDNGFRLTRDMLERKATDRTKALVMNFPTNPTGATLRREDVEGIAGFAVEHDIVVIADEIYSELTFDGSERCSVASIPGMKDRTIFLHGFSKAWAMTGFRLGYACARPDLIETMMKIHQYSMLCAPILSQKAALEALKHPRADVETMRAGYEQRRNIVHEELNSMGLPCRKPGGAFYAFPYVGGLGMNSKEFALRLLDDQQVACVPGSAFGPSGEGYLRCAFAGDLEDIREAMRRMAVFVKKIRAS